MSAQHSHRSVVAHYVRSDGPVRAAGPRRRTGRCAAYTSRIPTPMPKDTRRTPRKLACALPFWLGLTVVVALLLLFYYLLFLW
jgi:hypothetical protein